MTSSRDHRDYLEDICQTAQAAISFVQGMSYEGFAADVKTQFAVVRALEIVGEATKRIPAEIRDSHAEVPWRLMAGIRDKLIHDYVNVNLEIVWRSATEDMPALLPHIQSVIDGMES